MAHTLAAVPRNTTLQALSPTLAAVLQLQATQAADHPLPTRAEAPTADHPLDLPLVTDIALLGSTRAANLPMLLPSAPQLLTAPSRLALSTLSSAPLLTVPRPHPDLPMPALPPTLAQSPREMPMFNLRDLSPLNLLTPPIRDLVLTVVRPPRDLSTLSPAIRLAPLDLPPPRDTPAFPAPASRLTLPAPTETPALAQSRASVTDAPTISLSRTSLRVSRAGSLLPVLRPMSPPPLTTVSSPNSRRASMVGHLPPSSKAGVRMAQSSSKTPRSSSKTMRLRTKNPR